MKALLLMGTQYIFLCVQPGAPSPRHSQLYHQPPSSPPSRPGHTQNKHNILPHHRWTLKLSYKTIIISSTARRPVHTHPQHSPRLPRDESPCAIKYVHLSSAGHLTSAIRGTSVCFPCQHSSRHFYIHFFLLLPFLFWPAVLAFRTENGPILRNERGFDSHTGRCHRVRRV